MDAKISSPVRGWVILITMQSKRRRHLSGQCCGSGNNSAWAPEGREMHLNGRCQDGKNFPLQIPNYFFIFFLFIYFFRSMHWLLLHKMLMHAAERRTTWGEAAETRLLFQDHGVTLPPTAWQANTNFLLWLCAWLAATLEEQHCWG